MAELEDIDATLVTVGQPVEGGCCYLNFEDEPTLPTDAATAPGTGWESAGELSTDGFTESHSVTSTDHKGWHGSVLLTTIDEETNTYKLNFVEVNRPTVAKARYGAENVEVDEATGQVKHITGKPGKHVPCAICIDELESNGYLRRTVVEKAMVPSLDDTAHQKGSLMVYGMTFTANEVSGNTFHIFRAKPAQDTLSQQSAKSTAKETA